MSDGDERAGTMRDWPAKVLIAAGVMVVLALVVRGAMGTLMLVVAVPLLAFGGLSLMIRRGAFTPRR